MAINEQFQYLSGPELVQMLEHPTFQQYPLYDALGNSFRTALDSPYDPLIFHAAEANRHYLVGRTFSDRYPTVALHTRTESSAYERTGIGEFKRRFSTLSLWPDEPETIVAKLLDED